jgi:hypothetical protein
LVAAVDATTRIMTTGFSATAITYAPSSTRLPSPNVFSARSWRENEDG